MLRWLKRFRAINVLMAGLKIVNSILCKWKHGYITWEGTIQKLDVVTVLGRFDGYFWQEMCSRCFKIRWTAGRKKPFCIGAGRLSAFYIEHLKKKIDKV
mgnify:CR=1 FL=1